MSGTKSRIMCGVVMATTACACWSCGDLQVADADVLPLAILEVFPHNGETDVARDLMVVVVFSETVGFSDADSDLNESTFFLEDESGTKVDGTTVEVSEPDPQAATALLKLPDPSPLISGETYWVVLKGSIQGTDPDGDDTEPLGEDIRSYFVVQ